MTSKNSPIFIVGCPRSGTSLIRNILNSHSQIAFGPETHFLFELEKIVGSHWPRIERYEFDKTYWYTKIADFFNSFKSEYAQICGKERWGEKTPTYSYHLDFINQLFPSCQIIHVVRNGVDVVASHKERWGYKSVPRAIKTWKDSIEIVQEFSKTIPESRYYEIRYEDVVKDPESSLKGLFYFLNEVWEPDILNSEKVKFADSSSKYLEKTKNLNDKPSIYPTSVGNGKRSLDPFTKIFFSVYAKSLMQELNYF